MKTHNLLLLLILSLTLFKTLTSLKELASHLSTKTYDVRIINGFTSNSSMPLVVWCASEDGDDMGGRALQEREDYGWSVDTGVIFSRPARFVCTVKWAWRRKKFDAFWLSRDKYRCGVDRRCFWLVKEDGIYFGKSNDHGGNWIKDFSWM